MTTLKSQWHWTCLRHWKSYIFICAAKSMLHFWVIQYLLILHPRHANHWYLSLVSGYAIARTLAHHPMQCVGHAFVPFRIWNGPLGKRVRPLLWLHPSWVKMKGDSVFFPLFLIEWSQFVTHKVNYQGRSEMTKLIEREDEKKEDSLLYPAVPSGWVESRLSWQSVEDHGANKSSLYRLLTWAHLFFNCPPGCLSRSEHPGCLA